MPELRKDPIVGRWVIVSTERALRPNDYPPDGALETPEPGQNPFAEGNEHLTPEEVYAIRDPHSQANGPGWKVRVVPNRFPALRVEGELDKEGEGMYDKMNGVGAHEVIVETPHPTLQLEQQPVEGIAAVLAAYQSRMADLLKDPRFRYVMVFKNYGSRAGASLNHPHSQLIATPVTPMRIKEKLAGAQKYYAYKDRCIFNDILRQEVKDGDRLVYENDGFVVFCPFASRFPFETMILPKRQAAYYHQIRPDEIPLLADAVRVTLQKLARVLNGPQYNLLISTAPARDGRPGYWSTIDHDFRWHIEILPRLTLIAGFEVGTGLYINPTVPEDAAKALREASA